jgi:uncharacterized protein DUF1236
MRQDGECIMRQPNLITTAAAALLAGTIFAAAQGTPKQAPGGSVDGGGAGQVPHEQGQQPKARQEGQGQRGKQQQGQKDPGKQGTTGQRPGEQREQGKRGQAKDQGKAEQGKQGQVKDQRKGSTTGQGQPKEQQGQAKEGRRPEGQQGQARQGGSGSVTFTTEQRTHIRETVLVGGSAPRVTNVNFTISVGTEVPRTVRVVEVPSVLVEYRPEWRGYYYFVVNDQIIVVDRNHRIVAVLDV